MRLAAVLAARATKDKEQNDCKEMHQTRVAHLTACLTQAQMKPKTYAKSSDGQNRLTNLAHTELRAAAQNTVLAELKAAVQNTSDPIRLVARPLSMGGGADATMGGGIGFGSPGQHAPPPRSQSKAKTRL
eukprot:1004239-Rhodomonas_salina.1